jgi:hypothetical protein
LQTRTRLEFAKGVLAHFESSRRIPGSGKHETWCPKGGLQRGAKCVERGENRLAATFPRMGRRLRATSPKLAMAHRSLRRATEAYNGPPKLRCGAEACNAPPKLTTIHRSFGAPPKLTTRHRSFGAPPKLTTIHRSFGTPPKLTTALRCLRRKSEASMGFLQVPARASMAPQRTVGGTPCRA